jgi:hypothetical protein
MRTHGSPLGSPDFQLQYPVAWQAPLVLEELHSKYRSLQAGTISNDVLLALYGVCLTAAIQN